MKYGTDIKIVMIRWMLADLKIEVVCFLEMITIYETTQIHNPFKFSLRILWSSYVPQNQVMAV
jgi:hypothetical protein